MGRNVQIIYRRVQRTKSVDDYVKKKIAKIERLVDDITLCRVVIEAPHQHHNKGSIYHITIDLALPYQEIVVSNDHHDRADHQNMFVALRDAFNATTKQVVSKAKRKSPRGGARPQPPLDFEEVA